MHTLAPFWTSLRTVVICIEHVICAQHNTLTVVANDDYTFTIHVVMQF